MSGPHTDDVSTWLYLDGMPTRSRPAGPLRAALDDVNEAIRQLMQQPTSRRRTETYYELLNEWYELTRGDVEPAA